MGTQKQKVSGGIKYNGKILGVYFRMIRKKRLKLINQQNNGKLLGIGSYKDGMRMDTELIGGNIKTMVCGLTSQYSVFRSKRSRWMVALDSCPQQMTVAKQMAKDWVQNFENKKTLNNHDITNIKNQLVYKLMVV